MEMTFGKMWRVMIQLLLAPITRAAST
jgi:hypothetical protein